MGKKEEECLSFDTFFYNYGRYHNNTINKLIHLFCIPAIMVTLGIIVCHYTPTSEFNGINVNLSILLFNLFFCILYTMVEPVIGLCYSAWTIPGCWFCWTFTLATKDVEAYTGYTSW